MNRNEISAMYRWVDDPISETGHDLFDRSPYAFQIAKLIGYGHQDGTSMVYAISGEWGLGKSSLIALTEAHLKNIDDTWSIARFTPWATSDTHGLIREFYATLESAIGNKKFKEKFKLAASVMLQIASPLTGLIPNAYAADMAKNSISVAGTYLGNEQAGNWETEFSKAVKALKEYGRPILVIIDDIDRLQPDELTTLMKVVRLLGRLPNVHYLLAFDELSLQSSLEAAGLVKNQTDARRFLEKIIQHTFPTPPLTMRQLGNLYRQKLDPIAAKFGVEISNQTFLRDTLIGDILPQTFSTPRAIQRYYAHLRHRTAIINPADVNFVDVVLITIVQCAHPTLYARLPMFKRPLTDNIETASRAIERIISLAPAVEREQIELVLHHLFSSKFDWESDDIRTKAKSTIRMEDHFDNYFTMIVPSYDLSLAELEEARSEIEAHPSSHLPKLLRLMLDTDRDKAMRTLELAERYWELRFWAEVRPVVLTAILAVDDLDFNCIDDADFRKRCGQWAGGLLAIYFKYLVEVDFSEGYCEKVAEIFRQASLRFAMEVFSCLASVLDADNDTADKSSEESHFVEVDKLRGELVDRCIVEFIENLVARDNGDSHADTASYARFVVSAGESIRFRKELESIVNAGNVSYGDIAIRFIDLSGGPDWSMSVFCEGEFDTVFPDRNIVQIDFLDSFRNMGQIQGVDWGSRRQALEIE